MTPQTDQPLHAPDPPVAPRVLIIVPAFNESGSIRSLLDELQRVVPQADVVVVDDGSTDATSGCVPPPARLIPLPFNLGIGGAMQTGYRYASMHDYDVAIQVDADGQHPPDQVRLLLDELAKGDVDVVVGSRFLRDGDYEQQASRMLGIRLLNRWLRLLCGLKITDCTSGFRAVNRDVVRAFAHWYPDDYPEPEVLLLLHRADYRVREVPVRMKQRQAGETSIPFFRGLFYMVKVSVALVLDLMRHPWPKGKVGRP